MNRLSIVFPYWESPDMLREQVRHWLAWDEEHLAKTTFIVTDDCSSNYPLDVNLLKGTPLNIRAFRVTEKVEWNWRAPKNIGAYHAEDGWCLITDIDHVLCASQARALFSTRLDRRSAYHFERVTARTMKPHKSHSSSWLMTRAMYWQIGGYDESFVGTQRGWVGEFPGRVQKHVRKVQTLPVYLLRYDSAAVADATAKLPRGEEFYRAKVDQIKATWAGPKAMTFPYERLL